MTTRAPGICSVCSAEGLEVVRAGLNVAADDGTALEYEAELTHCPTCGVDYYTREQTLASSRARAAVLRAHEGLLTPQDIRDIRDRLGWTQAELEDVLGVGRKTVVRWEKGTVRQSRVADRLLRFITAHPQAVLYSTAATAGLLDNLRMLDVAQHTVHLYTTLGVHGYTTAEVHGGVFEAAGAPPSPAKIVMVAGQAVPMVVNVDDKAHALCEAA